MTGDRFQQDLQRGREYIEHALTGVRVHVPEPDFDAWIAEIREGNRKLRAAIIDTAVFRRDAKALREMAAKCRTCNGRGYSWWQTGPDSVENDVCSGCEDVQEALSRLEPPPNLEGW